jgi:hypothetical protein
MKFAALVLFSVVSMAARAQWADFSGNWKLNPDKVEWGQAPRFVLPQAFVIKQKGGDLAFTRTVLNGDNGSFDYTEKLDSKGDTANTVTSNNNHRLSVLAWAKDQQSFTITTQGISADGTLGSKVIETWTVDGAGKVLNVSREVHQADGGTYTIVGVFEKQ